MLEASTHDPKLDMFSESTVEDSDSTLLLDLFSDFDNVQPEPVIPSIEHAEVLRAELFGTSVYDLKPFESLQCSETTSFAAQDVAEGPCAESFTTPSSFDIGPVQDHQVNVHWQNPSPLSPVGTALTSPWRDAAHTGPTKGLLPAFSEEPLAVLPDIEKVEVDPTIEELLAENARLRALVASQTEPKTPTMTPRKRTIDFMSNNDSSPCKKTRQMSDVATTIVVQKGPIEALWSPCSSFEQGLELQQESNAIPVQHVSATSNLKPMYNDYYITHELSKMQDFFSSPPPPSPFKTKPTARIITSTPSKHKTPRAPMLSRRLAFTQAGASGSFSEDVLSSPAPVFAIESQISSPAAKRPRTKRAPGKKTSENKSIEMKTAIKRNQRVKATAIPTQQPKRSVQEIYALNFYSLTQEEKARLLLPLLQGIDPKTADATEAKALPQAAQNHSSSPVPISMISGLSTPVTPSAEIRITQSTSASCATHTPMPMQIKEPYSPQTAKFIALGFHPVDNSPTQINSSVSPPQLVEFDSTAYVAVSISPERVTAGISATQTNEDAHLFTQLERFNNSGDDPTLLSPSRPAADIGTESFQFKGELADSLTPELSQHDSTALPTFDHITKDEMITLDSTSDIIAESLALDTELDVITSSSDPTTYVDNSSDFDAITQFDDAFDDINTHFSPQRYTSHSPNASGAKMNRESLSPATSISMKPAADIGATRQREALEKAARLQAQGRKR